MHHLFLDDQRDPENAYIYPVKKNKEGIIIDGMTLEEASNIPNSEWEIVRSYDEFVNYIRDYGVPSVISFDHDLDIEHIMYYYAHTQDTGIIEYGNFKVKTGYHCAQFLVEHCHHNHLKLPKYFIHSANRYGASNIKKVLETL